MARRAERVDSELLARLESGGSDKIRVPLPKRKINEMFAIADQILGGRRVTAVCEDGESRLARIPGKMRRRQWVREGDLIVVQPWDFQDSKADVRSRYTKTQSIYLSRKGVLPEIVDLFGYSDDDITAMDEGDMEYDDQPTEDRSKIDEKTPPEEIEIEEEVIVEQTPESPATRDEDDIDSFFG
ncbi:MAG: translation initiation factor eIF-1A [Euryarchaeota archaeon]|jgi:translation initiation factor 1A|nr:translation initiation factor eIF-1A [Euryarchaeota archaeon]MBE38903.1 translation initiation factor eIF-1A [Euryarchaeota archaeon]|tara:strand:- start:95 stop:646 length:552 start_codon:yes stop_codon:yes gene_type:complete